jgi:hypothetical protein
LQLSFKKKYKKNPIIQDGGSFQNGCPYILSLPKMESSQMFNFQEGLSVPDWHANVESNFQAIRNLAK